MRDALGTRGLVALLGMLACGALSCSLISRPDKAEVKCVVDDIHDPCHEIGQVCALYEVCIPCADLSAREECDGVDNDCDGLVDENSDLDGDGYFACINRFSTQEQLDCDDADPTTHPGADEACDGRDNDCDRQVERSDVSPGSLDPSPCSSTEVCLSRSGFCVDTSTCLDGECSALSCSQDGNGRFTVCSNDNIRFCSGSTPCNADVIEAGSTFVCGTATHRCVKTAGPSTDLPIEVGAFGSACVESERCVVGDYCFPLESLNPNVASDTSQTGMCTHACRTDRDCPLSNGVCRVMATGVRACVKVDATPGGQGAAEACTQSSACRSYACNQDISDDGMRYCQAACGNSDDCPGSSYGCGLVPRTTVNTDPSTVSCLMSNASEFADKPCATSADCTDRPNLYCGMKRVEGTLHDVVRVCMQRSIVPQGFGALDEACSTDDDCLEHDCENGRCTASCATDADCSASASQRPRACLPKRRGNAWWMRCLEVAGRDNRPRT